MTISVRSTRPLLLSTAALALSCALVGCGGSSDEPGDAPGGSDSSATPSTEGSTDGEPSQEATSAEPSPDDEAADGERVEIAGLSINAPEGTTVEPISDDLVHVGFSGATTDAMQIASIPSYGSTLREQADIFRETAPYGPDLESQQPVEYAGTRWWHLAGSADGGTGLGTTAEVFGTTSGELQVYVVFELDRSVSDAEAQERIESVMGSAELTG